MKQHIVTVMVSLLIILYTINVSFLMNQPIELINPFEYYNVHTLSTLSLYIMTILFVSYSIFGFIISYQMNDLRHINKKSLSLFLVGGICFSLLVSRMSILLPIGLVLLLLSIVSKYKVKHLFLTLVAIYSSAIFIILIPIVILFWGNVSYLDINAFQHLVDTYQKHHLFDVIQINIQYFVTFIFYYFFVFMMTFVPGVLAGQIFYKRKESFQKLLLYALITISLGTAVKVIIFSAGATMIHFVALTIGSSMQGLGISMLLLIVLRKIELTKVQQTVQFLSMYSFILISECVVYLLFTGIRNLPYPALSLNDLFRQSITIAIILGLLHLCMHLLLQRKKEKVN